MKEVVYRGRKLKSICLATGKTSEILKQFSSRIVMNASSKPRSIMSKVVPHKGPGFLNWDKAYWWLSQQSQIEVERALGRPEGSLREFCEASSRLVLQDEEGALPSVKFLPSRLRRRMSMCTRISLYLANQVLQMSPEAMALDMNLQEVRSVFASRHGEVQVTLSLFEEIISELSLSPLSFSRSVHNTASGLYSIGAGSRAPTTAIAAGEASLTMGALEAALQAQCCNEPVLFVMADEYLPSMYEPYVRETRSGFGVALMLEPGMEGAAEGFPSEVFESLRVEGLSEGLALFAAQYFHSWLST